MRSIVDGVIVGEIFDDHAGLNVDELSRLCTVDRAYIMELVDEGVLAVSGGDATDWRFAGAALRRARTALRLQRDLDINLSGVALVLELLEELRRLRGELAGLR